MITTNVLQRTFHVRFGNATGTAFSVDKDSKQYLVAARHVVEGIAPGDSLHIFHDRLWKETGVNVIGVGEGEVDVTVLAAPMQLSPTYPLEANAGGLVLGQQVYFLGFPFGWDSGAEYVNRGFSVPFVKSGVLSAMIIGDTIQIYLDAQVNEGFSGGPVVFVPSGQPAHSRTELKLAGVVANYPTPKLRPVVTPGGNHVLDANNNPVGIRENPGFVVAFDIQHAVDLIDQNPDGFPLPAGQGSP